MTSRGFIFSCKQSKFMFGVVCAMMFTLMACQQKPTVVGSEAQYIVESAKLKNEIKQISKDSKSYVVVDLREPFEYEKFNIKGSLHFPMDDWFEPKGKSTVQLISTEAFVRRISLRGADPTKSILLISDDLNRSYAFQKLLRDVGFKRILNATIEDFRSNPLSQVQLENQKAWSVEAERFENDQEQINAHFRSSLPTFSTKARQASLQQNIPSRVPKHVRVAIENSETAIIQKKTEDQKLAQDLKTEILRLKLSLADMKVTPLNCSLDLSSMKISKDDFLVIEPKPNKNSLKDALMSARCLELSGYRRVMLAQGKE